MIDEIIPLIENKVIEVEASRAMYYYPDYLVAKIWSRIKKLTGVDAGIISHSQKRLTKFHIIYGNKSTFELFIEKILKDKSFFDKLEKDLNNARNSIVSKLESFNFNNINNEELCNFVKFYYDSCESLYLVSGILRCVDRGMMLKLNEYLKDKPNKDEIFRSLSVGDKPSYSYKENIELLKLAKKIKEYNLSLDSEEVKKDIKRITDSYCWLTGDNYKGKAKSVEDNLLLINEIITKNPAELLDESEKNQKNEIVNRDDFIKSLDSYGKSLAQIAITSVSLKDDFKFYINNALFKSKILFEEISRITGKEINFLKNLSPDEMNSILNNKQLDMENQKLREDEYILLGYDDKVIQIIGSELEFFKSKYLITDKNTQLEFKGRVASKGLGKGKAKVILSSKDFGKLETGDILVVNNTSPDYVPIMKKAAAIIAEEGGLTAHVSVVSREFGIPCIVGIKRITEILKDGDLVEVDANNGIVKIIEKAK